MLNIQFFFLNDNLNREITENVIFQKSSSMTSERFRRGSGFRRQREYWHRTVRYLPLCLYPKGQMSRLVILAKISLIRNFSLSVATSLFNVPSVQKALVSCFYMLISSVLTQFQFGS